MNFKKLLFWRKPKSVSMNTEKACDKLSGFIDWQPKIYCNGIKIDTIIDTIIDFTADWSKDESNPIDDIKYANDVLSKIDKDGIDWAFKQGKYESQYDKGFKDGRHYEAMKRFQEPEEN